MSAERPVRFFRNGRNQAVRIPREFEFSGEDGIMRKEGDRLIIEAAARKPDIRALLAKWRQEPPIKDDPFEIDDPPPEPVLL